MLANGQQKDTENPPPVAERSSASSYEATWTHFVASAVAGDGSNALVYGAKLDGYATVDGRPRDRFGLAYFRMSLSEALRNGLEPILALGPEQGAVAFYTFDAARGRVRATLTAQIVDPVKSSAKTAAFLGLRTLVRF